VARLAVVLDEGRQGDLAMSDIGSRMADTQAAMLAVDEEDAALDKARAETRRALARNEARLKPGRDRYAKNKADHAEAINALMGCLEALKSIPPRMRSGDMERQIRRAEKALGLGK
jgi:hypothetical protein